MSFSANVKGDFQSCNNLRFEEVSSTFPLNLEWKGTGQSPFPLGWVDMPPSMLPSEGVGRDFSQWSVKEALETISNPSRMSIIFHSKVLGRTTACVKS